MGQEPPRPQAPKPTIDDALLDMRMAAKRFANESKRCEKEKDKLMNQAKQAMQKNNEEGARLFLTSAVNKQKEAENLQRMSHKMDYMQGLIKNSTNQTKTVEALNKIQPILTQQIQQMPLEQIYMNMNQFEQAMDEIQVQGKVMDGMLNKNQDVGQDLAIDQMMGQLKQELHNEVSNDLNANPNMLFKELNQQNQQSQAPALNNNQIK